VFDVRRRKLVASCAVLWTILGVVIGLTYMSTVKQDSRPLVIGAILTATLAGIGATFAALQGLRRLATLLLLVTVIYPTYFGWPVNLIPLLLAGYLIFLGIVRAI
jgi:hypothetical protein